MERNRETGKVVSLTTDMDVYDYIRKLDAAILMSKIALFCQLTWLASLIYCIVLVEHRHGELTCNSC